MDVNSTTHPQIEESCLVSCISSGVGAGAFVVYGIVELAKWAFNHLKDFFYYLGLSLWEYTASAFYELEKGTVFLTEVISETISVISKAVYLVLKNLAPLFSSAYFQFRAAAQEAIPSASEIVEPISQFAVRSAKASLECVQAGFYQVGSFSSELPGAIHESVEVPREMASALFQNLAEYWHSLGYQAKTLLIESLYGAAESASFAWSLLRDEVYQCLDIAASGGYQLISFFQEIPPVLDEATEGLRALIKAVIFNLLDYVASGMHQLVLLMDEIAPILATILLGTKDAILAVARELVLYLSCGFQEFKKLIQAASETASEILGLTYEFVKEVTLNLCELLKSFGREALKSWHLVVDGSALILEAGAVLKQNIGEILSAGLEQAKRLIIHSTVAILDKIPYALFVSILENIFQVLAIGGDQLNRFLIEATYSAIDGYTSSKEMIYRLSLEVWELLKSASLEGVKLASDGAVLLIDGFQVTFELVAAVLENLFEYLESGYNQSLVFGMLLKEDLPDTFRDLVQDPLEAFIAPKYRWVKAKVLELRRLSEERMARIREATYRRFGEIRDATQRRLEEILRRRGFT